MYEMACCGDEECEMQGVLRDFIAKLARVVFDAWFQFRSFVVRSFWLKYDVSVAHPRAAGLVSQSFFCGFWSGRRSHAAAGYRFEKTLDFRRNPSEAATPKVVTRILNELNEGNQQSPGMRSVDDEPLEKDPGINVSKTKQASPK